MSTEWPVSERETLLQRAREGRASAARARRLSTQLLSQADRANLDTYADWLEAEAEALERAAGAAACGKDLRRRSSR
jgi:hypothetical protein